MLMMAGETRTSPGPRPAAESACWCGASCGRWPGRNTFFTKDDNVVNLNKVMAYVVANEFTNRLKIVTLLNPADLLSDIGVLSQAYEQISVDVVVMTAHLGPELVNDLSKQWNIPKNFLFIGSTGDWAPYHISELGGVRLII